MEGVAAGTWRLPLMACDGLKQAAGEIIVDGVTVLCKEFDCALLSFRDMSLKVPSPGDTDIDVELRSLLVVGASES